MQKATRNVFIIVILLTAWAAYAAMPKSYSSFNGYNKRTPLIIMPIKTIRQNSYSSGGSSYGK